MSCKSSPTPQPRWRIRGSLTTTSPMHIGTGDVTNFDHPQLKDKDGNLNDVQAVVKDYTGKPCVPGTAIKGVLRSWAEAMLISTGAGHQRFDSPIQPALSISFPFVQ